MKAFKYPLFLAGLLSIAASSAMAQLDKESIARQISNDEGLTEDLVSFYVSEEPSDAAPLAGHLIGEFEHLACPIVMGAFRGYPELDDDAMVEILNAAVEANPNTGDALVECLSEAYPESQPLIARTVREKQAEIADRADRELPRNPQSSVPTDDVDVSIPGFVDGPPPPPTTRPAPPTDGVFSPN